MNGSYMRTAVKINSLTPKPIYSKQNIPVTEDGLNITWIFLAK